MTTCPHCGAVLAREPWTLARRLGQQVGTLCTMVATATGAIISQADTLPHPWQHVLTVAFLLSSIGAAVRLKT